MISAEFYLDLMSLAVACDRDYASADLITVNGNLLDTLVYVSRVLDLHLVNVASELTDSLESVPSCRDGRINGKAVKLRLDAEDVLGDGYHVPCCSTREPGVLALTEVLCVLTADHLTVNIRFCLMDVGCLFSECGSDL